MDVAKSRNGVLVRLTEERWFHITENHDDLAGYYDEVLDTIENPDYVIKGYKDALVALRKTGENTFLSVVYREIEKKDGFVITSYFTSRMKLENEVIVWRKRP